MIADTCKMESPRRGSRSIENSGNAKPRHFIIRNAANHAQVKNGYTAMGPDKEIQPEQGDIKGSVGGLSRRYERNGKRLRADKGRRLKWLYWTYDNGILRRLFRPLHSICPDLDILRLKANERNRHNRRNKYIHSHIRDLLLPITPVPKSMYRHSCPSHTCQSHVSSPLPPRSAYTRGERCYCITLLYAIARTSLQFLV